MSSWTEDRVERLFKLWEAGFSAAQIADKLGGVTRSAVIGKIHRERGSGTKPKPAPRKVMAKKKPPSSRTRSGRPSVNPLFDADDYEPGPEIEVPIGERKSLMQLEADDCRWPIGDPQEAWFHFCNRKALQGLPYCKHHAHRAYRPEKVRMRPTSRPSYNHQIIAQEKALEDA